MAAKPTPQLLAALNGIRQLSQEERDLLQAELTACAGMNEARTLIERHMEFMDSQPDAVLAAVYRTEFRHSVSVLSAKDGMALSALSRSHIDEARQERELMESLNAPAREMALVPAKKHD